MTVKKRVSKKRGSRHEKITTATSCMFAHEGSSTIIRRSQILTVEADTLDRELDELKMRMAAATRRRNDVHAELDGLQAVVSKR